MLLRLAEETVQVFDAIKDTLKSMLDFLELLVGDAPPGDNDEPEPQAIPAGFRPDLHANEPGTSSDGKVQAPDSSMAAPSTVHDLGDATAHVCVRTADASASQHTQPATAASTAAGSEPETKKGSAKGAATHPAGSAAAPQSTAQPCSVAHTVLTCCRALADLLGVMPDPLTDRLLTILPSVCRWATRPRSMDTPGDAAAERSREVQAEVCLGALGMLVPILWRKLCTSQSHCGEKAGRAEWLKAVAQPESVATLALVAAVTCSKCIVQDDTPCELAWARVSGLYLGPLCDVLAAAVPQMSAEQQAEWQHICPASSNEDKAKSSADAGLGDCTAGIQCVVRGLTNSSRPEASLKPDLDRAKALLSMSRLLIVQLRLYNLSGEQQGPAASASVDAAVTALHLPLRTLLAAGVSEAGAKTAQPALEALPGLAESAAAFTAASAEGHSADDMGAAVDSMLERTLQVCASLSAVKERALWVRGVVQSVPWFAGALADSAAGGTGLMYALEAVPLTAPVAAALKELAA
jgi:hypothetical protein